MRIATWNINSVRLRIDLVKKLADQFSPDVICLQETKTIDDTFPAKAIREMGYDFQHIHGMKSYNGVAILSKIPFIDCQIRHSCGKEDCRHIYATLENGVEIHSLYIPAGGDIPDPELNEKFAHKLQFIEELKQFLQATHTPEKKRILVGDFNIAPLEHDVWSHKQLLKVVSHTPIEVDRLTDLQNDLGWVDSMREFVPTTEKLYSWWSYRARDWEKSNKGRRLDHIWVSPNLKSGLNALQIPTEARGWQPKPSDHVPVLLDVTPSKIS